MNIICIVNDSLRADHCGCYDGVGGINAVQYRTAEGLKKTATPNLDRLAAEGVLFSHCYAESLPTIPTRTTWWTGRVGFPFKPWQPFQESDYLLAEVLWSHGYTSALVTDVYHGHKPVYNIGRGFDTTVFVRGQEYDPWIVDDRTVDTNIWHRLRGDDTDPLWVPRFEQYMKNRSTFQTEEDFFAPRVTHEAIRWLDAMVNQQGKKDKLFLWVDYFDPHEPWDPPEPFWSMYKTADYSGQDIIDPVAGTCTKIGSPSTEKPQAKSEHDYLTPDEIVRVRSLYAGEVTFTDKWVGVLVDHVRDLGLLENTLIVWLSDHGEPFGEHGIIRKARPWNYEELVRIPMVFRPPEAIKSANSHQGVIDALVQPTDLFPTILDLLGIGKNLTLSRTGPRPTAELFPQDMQLGTETVTLHGHSLAPLIRGETDSVRDYAYTGHHDRSWSIQDTAWRLHVPLEGDAPSELYDRGADPYDQHDVVADYGDLADDLELQLRRWVARL